MLNELSLENPLVIIGDEDVILGFRALGFKTYSISQQKDFKTILAEIVKNNTAICLVQEDIYNMAKDQINSYKNMPLPIFIPFVKTGKTDLLDNIIKDIRLKATGAF